MGVALLNPLNYLYPERCVLCGCLMLPTDVYDYPVCRTCEDSLTEIQGERCTRCSRYLISEKRLCMYCRTRDYAFTSNMSLFEYRDKARELIYQYKFKGRCMLARLFARRIYHMYCTYFPDCGVIPIPSSFIKRRKRGWDHIGFITEILAKTYHLPVYCVLKKHHTRDQKDLPYRDRLTNIKGTISVAQKHHNLPEHVVLIDDVFTTGGTVSECSRVLLNAGVESVSSITIAID